MSARVVGSAVLATVVALMVAPTAVAQDSGGTNGSETDGQRVSVSHNGDDGSGNSSSSSGAEPACCGSEVTVTTDEGTSHPSSGGCRQRSEAPAVDSSDRSPESFTPSILAPETIATASPTIAPPPPSPVAVAPQRTDRRAVIGTERKTSAFPFAPIAVAIAIAAAGYGLAYGLRRVFVRIAERRSLPNGWAMPIVERTGDVRILPRRDDVLPEPYEPAPTLPINIDFERLTQAHTEADILSSPSMNDSP
jgi:hypothetical protein